MLWCLMWTCRVRGLVLFRRQIAELSHRGGADKDGASCCAIADVAGQRRHERSPYVHETQREIGKLDSRWDQQEKSQRRHHVWRSLLQSNAVESDCKLETETVRLLGGLSVSSTATVCAAGAGGLWGGEGQVHERRRVRTNATVWR